MSHNGFTDLHISCPNPTNIPLMLSQYFLSTIFSNSILVLLGSFVLLTHLSLFAILWIWVSTATPSTCWQHSFKYNNPIFLPIPGNFTISSKVSGASSSYSSLNFSASFFIFFALTLWKDTLNIISTNSSSDIFNILSIFNPYSINFWVVSYVILSLVCGLNIKETKPWNFINFLSLLSQTWMHEDKPWVSTTAGVSFLISLIFWKSFSNFSFLSNISFSSSDSNSFSSIFKNYSN